MVFCFKLTSCVLQSESYKKNMETSVCDHKLLIWIRNQCAPNPASHVKTSLYRQVVQNGLWLAVEP